MSSPEPRQVFEKDAISAVLIGLGWDGPITAPKVCTFVNEHDDGWTPHGEIATFPKRPKFGRKHMRQIVEGTPGLSWPPFEEAYERFMESL